MKRVAVVGCAGVGKTTFSRQLAKKAGLPLVHLDYYFHDKNQDYLNDREAWIKRVEKLITEQEWIIDGNYRSTFELRFSHADTIIFLDYARWRALLGAYKRRIQFRNKLREDMPDGWQEKIDWQFFKFIWGFNEHYRPDIISAIEQGTARSVITFRKPSEAAEYLESL